ncbi:MAG: hypothetical protein M3340_03810 [Actinomycetota bacterium]|nr:hypothetical protein [Actinomycetota bacterium]
MRGARVVKTVVRGMAVAALACACAAGPAHAASVSLLADIRMSSYPMIYFVAAPGEDNDIEVQITEGAAPYPKAVKVIDRGATLTSGPLGPPPCGPGSGCSAPCRIESAHVAHCRIEDAYGPSDPSSTYPAISWFDASLGDGDDRVTTLPQVGLYSKLRDDDGGDHFKLGAGGRAGAGTGDVVEFGNPLATGEVTAGGGTVLARDGGQQTIYCYTYAWGRIEKDPLDKAMYYCSGIGPLGDVAP